MIHYILNKVVILMNKNGILVIDLEMTCWEKGDQKGIREIIQVGIVNLDPMTLQETNSQSYYVKPKYNTELSEYCKNLTGLTDKQVFKEGNYLGDVMNSLSKKWGFSRKVLIFWGDDHLDFKRDCDRLEIEDKTSKNVINFGLQYSLFQSFKNQEGFRNIGLTNAMKAEGLVFEGRQHDGLVDAKNTARLYKTFMNRQVRSD